MLLGKPKILKYLDEGKITIDPFIPVNLGSAQYDVRLGHFCYREVSTGRGVYNPYDEDQVLRKWQLDEARLHEEVLLDHFGVPFKNIGLDERIMLIQPGETILAHTEEFIGGSCNHVTSMMKARSSMGRNHIEVCKCAGMGDVGYFNRWTMEITNNSPRYTLPLVEGRRIAQILFFEVDPVEKDDVYDQSGKYQTTSSLMDLKGGWKPEAMLPKQWLDREVKALQARKGI